MKRLVLLCVLGTLLLARPRVATATTVIDTIDPFFGSGIDPIGEVGAGESNGLPSGNPHTSYFGQTFVAPSGLASELSFFVTPNPDSGTDNTEFRVLLTETRGQ